MGKLDDFSLDQMAGAAALIISSVGGLLLIVFKSRCREIKCCYGLWSCVRELPEEDPKGRSQSDTYKDDDEDPKGRSQSDTYKTKPKTKSPRNP